MSYPRSRYRRAFTLVELLAVLTILILLAGLCFPVFAKVRQNAARATCTSNCKQVALAFLLYAQDNDERLPCGNQAPPSPYLGIGWASQLVPYAKSPQLWKCPADTSRATASTVSISYAFNTNLIRSTNNAANTFLLQPLPAFIDPTRTVLCNEVRWGRFDANDVLDVGAPVSNGNTLFGANRGNGDTSLQMATGLFSNSPADSSNSNNRDASGDAFDGAHSDGSIYLALDGHVKWFRSSQISAGVANVPGGAQTGLAAESATYGGLDRHALTYSFR